MLVESLKLNKNLTELDLRGNRSMNTIVWGRLNRIMEQTENEVGVEGLRTVEGEMKTRTTLKILCPSCE